MSTTMRIVIDDKAVTNDEIDVIHEALCYMASHSGAAQEVYDLFFSQHQNYVDYGQIRERNNECT